MTKKESFESGLDALFGEAPKRTKPQQTTEPEHRETLGTLEGRGDILSKLQDQELRALLRAKRMEGRGRPRKNAYRDSLTEGYTRATMIVNEAKYSRLRELSLEQTKTIKEVVEEAFDLLIEKYGK